MNLAEFSTEKDKREEKSEKMGKYAKIIGMPK